MIEVQCTICWKEGFERGSRVLFLAGSGLGFGFPLCDIVAK